ncbi:MAG: DUF3006 domain-containing protein [Atribacterota bacterium]|jgi:hypothetical protein|nr:DUF3006 domain-containing protein [Atribacterota bacterium]
MKKFIIDRFEGKWAIIETIEKPTVTFNLSKDLLPNNSKEGDVLEITIVLNKGETLKRKNEIQNKLNSLKKQDKGNNISL